MSVLFTMQMFTVGLEPYMDAVKIRVSFADLCVVGNVFEPCPVSVLPLGDTSGHLSARRCRLSQPIDFTSSQTGGEACLRCRMGYCTCLLDPGPMRR